MLCVWCIGERRAKGAGGQRGPSMIFQLWHVVWNFNDVIVMNYEHMYTKNINIHLIYILDKNNRRQGVFWQQSYEDKLIYLYESLDEFMWFLLKIFCFVWYIILPLFSSHYFSQEITLGRDNRLNFPPLPLGQREPGQRGPAHFNTKTIQHGPLCPRTFDGYIFHKLIPVNEIFVYYLVLCPTKYVTMYIKWKVFFIFY